jgi:hypothetical protein
MNDASVVVDDADVHHLGVEDVADLVADQVVHGLHVEVLGERLLHAVHDGELGGPLIGLGQEPLRFLEQPRVLERDPHARRERHEESFVALCEKVSLEAFQPDHSDGSIAREDRDAQPTLRLPADDDGPQRRGVFRSSQPNGMFRADDGRCQSVTVGDHRLGLPFSVLNGIRESELRRFLVEEADEERRRAEDRPDPLTDEVDDRVELELSSQRGSDLVDERELGVALARLLDGAHPRQRGGDVLRDEAEKLQILGGMAAIFAIALRDDDADRPPVRLQRCRHPVDARHAEHPDAAALDHLALLGVVNEDRLAVFQHVPGESGGLADADRLPHHWVRDVQVDLVAVEGVIHQAAPIVVQRDIEVLGVHQLADDLVNGGVERDHVLRRAGGLGDPVEGALHPFGSRVLCLASLELCDAGA